MTPEFKEAVVAGGSMEDLSKKLHEDKQLQRSAKWSLEVLIITWSCRWIVTLDVMAKAQERAAGCKTPQMHGSCGKCSNFSKT